MPLNRDEIDGAMADLLNAVQVICSNYKPMGDGSDIHYIIELNDQLDVLVDGIRSITETLDEVIHRAIKDGGDILRVVGDSQ